MSCDYHDRVDFRAFDVMVRAIDKATPAELYRARETCKEQAAYRRQSGGRRKAKLWQSFALLLTTEMTPAEWRRLRREDQELKRRATDCTG